MNGGPKRMIHLDDLQAMQSLDPGGMMGAILGFPGQCRDARRIGLSVQAPEGYRSAANIVILGMGGSAIGGDLLRSLFENEFRVPVAVNRDYGIPNYVNEHTLVIASSYSGNTEETLSGYAEARRRKAMIAAICTGGKLKELATADGYPVITIPGGLSPRAALGYSFHPLMAVMERLGYLAAKDSDFEEMADKVSEMARRFGPEAPLSDNPTKQLAERLHDRLPVIYGAGGWRAVVAARWKGQINENAKNIAYWNAFPELNHNETVGWEAPVKVTNLVHNVILRGADESPRLSRRVEVTHQIMQQAVEGFTEIRAEGKSPLAHMFSLVYTGDFVSYYLSMLNGIDPTPVRVIDRLKAELAKLG